MHYSIEPRDQIFENLKKVMDFCLLLIIWSKILVKI